MIIREARDLPEVTEAKFLASKWVEGASSVDALKSEQVCHDEEKQIRVVSGKNRWGLFQWVPGRALVLTK